MYGQDEEDDEYLHGLNAHYASSAGNVDRIDDDIAFDWGSDAPDPRVSPANFTAEWTGRLLVREASNYRFHAHLAGEVEVELDGKSICSSRTEQPGWISGGPTPVSFGEKKIRIRYRKAGPAARLNLYWSSDVFPLEPLPAHLLFRDRGDGRAAIVDRGRILFDAHRCNRCHRRSNDSPSMPAPDLATIAGNVDPGWLMKQIEDPDQATRHAKMPRFGLTTDDARAVAAYLWFKSAPVKLENFPAAQKPKKGSFPTAEEERRAGEVLFRSVGCLACHRVAEFGYEGPYSGGDLGSIGQKRSREWLFTWLGDPGRLNRDHRMPTIKLTSNERRSLAVFLAGLRSEEGHSAAAILPSADATLIARGGKVIESARCVACHRIPDITPTVFELPDLSHGVTALDRSCLAERPENTRRRPAYGQIDRDSIVAFLNSRKGPIFAEGRFARGAHLLERRNCTDCHERGLGKGMVDTAGRLARSDTLLQGQSEALIPPALTAVGDKLLDAALVEAVSGDQKTVRLPWLRVRMPHFEHSAADKADLAACLISHDRIPDGAPIGPSAKKSQPAAASQALVDGHSLVGPKGFVCISCHEMGAFTPRNVALGTHGSDLLMLGKRMRKPFYLRWTRAPLRIVPGMEMPSYARAIPDILGGDINAQLEATWDALNDPRFVPPTDNSAVEQFATVEPGTAPRIVRDVFTAATGKAGGVARAFAVGFDNGHNLLFDLDRGALHQWMFGDFARERTAGKSWFWEMAGLPVFVNRGRGPDIVLRQRGSPDGRVLVPASVNGTGTRLLDYRTSAKGEPASVQIRYRLFFNGNAGRADLNVQETYRPIYAAADGRTPAGWERAIDVESAMGGRLSDFDVLFVRPKLNNTAGVIDVVDDAKSSDSSSPLEYVTLREQGATRTMVLRYTSPLVRNALKSQPAAEPTLHREQVTSLPGYDGVRLPLNRKIMPTAVAWTRDSRLAFTSLEGHVYTARDTDGDGIEDQLTLFEEGLAAPYGLIADGDDLIVCHKPEVLRLRDTNHDGRADVREVIATGWGYSSNYHDWTTSIVRDSAGNFFVGLGSDYNQEKRPKDVSLWRGKVLKIDRQGAIAPIGHAFRYPTGLAIDRDGRIFVSDNQGVQNTFNEINHLVEGKHYGVPSRWEEDPTAPTMPPAIQVPHPWTRSVNGLFFLNEGSSSPFNGHGIGCEYDSRFLVRFTTEEVEGVMQGAVYEFSRPNSGTGSDNFLGPLCGGVAPNGDIYVGSINDSGWQGGQNTGDIVRLRRNGSLPNGMKELTATDDGFAITFLQPVDAAAASKAENYSVSGYTRVWKGGYATPDSDRHRANVQSVDVAADATRVTLHLDGLRLGHVYEVHCAPIQKQASGKLFPDTGYYTLHRRPRAVATR